MGLDRGLDGARLDLAHLFQNVFESDQARGAPVLIHDDGHVHAALAHLLRKEGVGQQGCEVERERGRKGSDSRDVRWREREEGRGRTAGEVGTSKALR